jgi:hypothetical protein
MPPCSRKRWAKPLSSRDTQRIRKRKQFAKASLLPISSSSSVSNAIAKAASTIARSAAAAIKKATSAAVNRTVAVRRRTAEAPPPAKKTLSKKTGTCTKTKAPSSAAASAVKRTNVYVLELEGGYVYVGKTNRAVEKRLKVYLSFN